MRLDDIEKVYKKRRHDKDSRLTTVLVRKRKENISCQSLTLSLTCDRVMQEGRADREKPTRKPKRQNPFASTTNREKTKSKNFMMLKQKAKGKAKRSFKDKQVNCLLFVHL